MMARRRMALRSNSLIIIETSSARRVLQALHCQPLPELVLHLFLGRLRLDVDFVHPEKEFGPGTNFFDTAGILGPLPGVVLDP